MIEALRIIRLVGRAFFGELFLLFLLSILIALTAPLILPFPPAVAGLWVVARRIAEGRTVRVRDWWEGFLRYFFPAWGLAFINLVVVGLTTYNLHFYSLEGGLPFQAPAWLRGALQGFWVAALLIWAGWQLYTLPVLVEQERPHLLQALRRALSLVVAHPACTVSLLLAVVVLSGASLLALGLGLFVAPGMLAVLTVFITRCLIGKEIVEP